MLAVLDAVAKAGNWGRAMPPGTAQGIGIHHEYKGYAACVAEIDCTPATVNRQVKDGYTGPRVTKVVFAVDVGLPINPLGLEAQMMGGIMDGIAQALTYSLHLKDGHFLEGSWDNAYYTRQWNAPARRRQVIVMPPTTSDPGGAGEFGVAAVDGRRGQRLRAGHREAADELPDQPQPAARVHAAPDRAADPAVAHRRICSEAL